MNHTTLEWLEPDSWASPAQIECLQEIWRAFPVEQVVDRLGAEGIECCLVGGVVRDLLLGRKPTDVDFLVLCSGAKLLSLRLSLAEATACTAVPLDSERGIVRLCHARSEDLDLVSLQAPELLDDLARRDLSFNALVIDSKLRLLDPFQGRRDLAAQTVRALSLENLRADPLRVLRCLRFAAQLGFEIDHETLDFMRIAVTGLANVAGERIRAELFKFFPAASSELLQHLAKLRVASIILPEPVCEPFAQNLRLMEELAEAEALTPELAIALLFESSMQSGTRALGKRLALSRPERRYLEHWKQAARFLREAKTLTPLEIYQTRQKAGPILSDLLALVENCSFPSQLSPDERQTLVTEARGEGNMRWSPPPWSGEDLMNITGRPNGAWLGKSLEELKIQWACREIEELSEAGFNPDDG